MADPLIPDTLLTSLRERQCIAWCGAGISLMAGLPTWSQLIKALLEACDKKGLKAGDREELHQLLKDSFYDDVAEYCRDVIGTQGYHEFLIQLFRAPRTASGLHAVLAKLPFAGIVTTNYDTVLDHLIVRERSVLPPILSNEKADISALWRSFARNEFFVLKAHGDINRPQTVILTSADYARLTLGNPAYMQFIQMLFVSKCILFVGTSLSDAYVRRTLEEVRYVTEGLSVPHFAICPRPGPILTQSWRDRFNVTVIPYDHEEETAASYEAAVVKVLSEIQARMDSSPQA